MVDGGITWRDMPQAAIAAVPRQRRPSKAVREALAALGDDGTIVEQEAPQRRRRKPAKPKDTTPEADISGSIIDYLNGLPECYALKVAAGYYGKHGQPDIYGCYRGRFLALETKRPSKRSNTSPLQKVELRRWLEAGAVSEVVTSLAEVQAIIRVLSLQP